MKFSSTSVAPLADLSGWDACAEKTREERSEAGQFFTPAPIAHGLAGWFLERGLNQRCLHLLDPGAGGGVLTAAVVDRIVELRQAGRLPLSQDLTLEAWELDGTFLPALKENLSACAAALATVGVRCHVDLHHGSYIAGAVSHLNGGLFGSGCTRRVTHAILNPPYKKITSRSQERMLLHSIGMETTNLYAAFVWLALHELVDGGELSAITPRSFCNGPYFREFRRDLTQLATFHRLHVFDSRTEAFGRDEVLQENVLFHLSRGSGRNDVIELSTGRLDAPVLTKVPVERFISTADPDRVMHIATETDADEIRDYVQGLPCRLEELGLEVSTGPVVDFRLKESLRYQCGANTVPLLYPHGIKAGHVIPPLDRADQYQDARIAKKPVAIVDNEETHRWLLPIARFVLIKRFSSKEEKRRLVAGVLDPADFRDGLIGMENHVNFFHRKRKGLSAAMARGLCRFLNSSVADRYFRQFNGHTQVNASDLRAFRYPDAASLERLGNANLDDGNQEAIDLAMHKILNAPSFTES